MTAAILSFRHGRPVAPDHLAILAEVLTRDGCRCWHCRAPGGELVLYRQWNGRDSYIVIDWGEAFDAVTGQLLGTVPDAMLPRWGNARIVLDLAYINHKPEHVGRPGARPNVVALCRLCSQRHDDDAAFQRWAR